MSINLNRRPLCSPLIAAAKWCRRSSRRPINNAWSGLRGWGWHPAPTSLRVNESRPAKGLAALESAFPFTNVLREWIAQQKPRFGLLINKMRGLSSRETESLRVTLWSDGFVSLKRCELPATWFTPHECEINTIRALCIQSTSKWSGASFTSFIDAVYIYWWSNALNGHSPFILYFLAIITATQLFNGIKKWTDSFGI